MAWTIRKRQGKKSVSYQLDLGIVDGKRTQKSFPTLDAAEARRDELKRELRKHGTESLNLTDADRRRFLAAQDKLQEYGATIGDAVTFYVTHHKPREKITFVTMVSRCCDAKDQLNKRRKYVEELRRAGMKFAEEGHGHKDAATIAQSDVERWLGNKGWAPKSQIVYLINLTTIFSWGLENGHVTINPCVKVKRLTLDEKPPEILSVEQCRRLMDAALATESSTLRRGLSLQLLAYTGLCLFAGVRPEEAQRLDWSEIHLEDRFIEIPALKSKTRRRRIVSMSENLAKWLAKVEIQEGSVTPVGFQKRHRTLREVAEIRHWPQDVLRHSFASYHLAKHQSAEQTALQMGHSGTQMLFSHYRELVRPKNAEFFWKILPTT